MMTKNYHLLVVVVITRVVCTGLLVTCMGLEGDVSRFPRFWMPSIRTSENSLDKGSAVPRGGKGEHRRNTAIHMWEEQQRTQGSSERKAERALNRKHVPTKKSALEWSGPTHIIHISCLLVCTSKNADKNSYCVAKCTYHTAQVQSATSSRSFTIHHVQKRTK